MTSERQQLDAVAEGHAVERLRAEDEALRGRLITLEDQKERLTKQIEDLREQLEQCDAERAKLEVRVAEAERENLRFFARYMEAEERSTHFATLFVASCRLHGVRTRAEVCTTIQEIIANLVGSEEIVIFEMNDAGSALEAVAAYGVDMEPYKRVPLGEGVLGQAAMTGEMYRAPGQPIDGEPTACLPLKFDNRVIGAIAIFRLLTQKSALGTLDFDLLDVLGDLAATAMHVSGLRDKAEQKQP